MPKSKNPNAYPYAYHQTFKSVVEDGRTITVNFTSKSEAEQTRFDMYGYRNALEYARDPFYQKAAGIVMKIRVNLTSGYDLILTSTIDDPINAKLMEAINKKVPANLPGEPTPYCKEFVLPSVASDLTIQENEPSIMSHPSMVEEEEDTNEQSVYKQYMPSSAQDKEEG